MSMSRGARLASGFSRFHKRTTFRPGFHRRPPSYNAKGIADPRRGTRRARAVELGALLSPIPEQWAESSRYQSPVI